MSVTRWDPLSEVVSLRDAMDNLLRESFVRPLAGMTANALSVPLDVRETDNEYIINAVLPGVRPQDLQLHVKGDTLQISGEIKQEQEHEGSQQGQWLLRERRYGHFQRTLGLPASVQSDEANATFENGILRVTLPKTQYARPTSIPIQASQNGHKLEPETVTQSQS